MLKTVYCYPEPNPQPQPTSILKSAFLALEDVKNGTLERCTYNPHEKYSYIQFVFFLLQPNNICLSNMPPSPSIIYIWCYCSQLLSRTRALLKYFQSLLVATLPPVSGSAEINISDPVKSLIYAERSLHQICIFLW